MRQAVRQQAGGEEVCRVNRGGGRGEGVGWGYRCDGGGIHCGGVEGAGGGRCGHNSRLSALRLVHVKVR